MKRYIRKTYNRFRYDIVDFDDFNNYDKGGWDYKTHNIEGRSIYYWRSLILRNHINKPFNHAFSKWRKRIGRGYDDVFLREFSEYRHKWYWSYYYIDENGFIQLKHRDKNKKEGYLFRSYDYKEGWIDIKSGETAKNPWLALYPNRYVKVIVSGFEEYFPDKKDKRLVRLKKERLKLKKRGCKLYKKSLQEMSYSMISKSEIELKKQKELDMQKLLKHGFDPKTSFRTDKQTNPDLIQENQ